MGTSLQKRTPQAVDVRRQIQVGEQARDLIQVQATDILCPPVHQYLSDGPSPLKRVVQVDAVRTPGNVTWNAEIHRPLLSHSDPLTL